MKHLIACGESKYIKGITDPGSDKHNELINYELRCALEKRWDSDAHFVTYATDSQRYRKPIAELKKVYTRLLVFDYDNPGHEPWRSSGEVLEWFDSAISVLPPFYCIYTTNNGARIILKMRRQIDVRAAQEIHKILVADLSHKGLELDKQCSDWTRLFRLPYVIREDSREPTWDNPFIDVVIAGDLFIPAAVPDIDNFPHKIRKTLKDPMPGPEIRDLIWTH